MCQRISKIQLQSDIMSRFGSNFKFPRLDRKKKTDTLRVHDLPELNEILNVIEKCKRDALQNAIELGFIEREKANEFDFACKTKPYTKKEQRSQTKNKKTSNLEFYRSLDLNKINLKNYATHFIGKDIDESSAFIKIPSVSGHSERKIYKINNVLLVVARRQSQSE